MSAVKRTESLKMIEMDQKRTNSSLLSHRWFEFAGDLP